MNIVDKHFYALTDHLKNLSLQEIYQNTRSLFLNLPLHTQQSISKFLNNFPYWGEINIDDNNFEELYNRAKMLKEHLNDLIWLYENLEDCRSKKTLFAILNNLYQFDFFTLKHSIETTYPHYFDLDIISANDDEVFVDLGAYTGDTIQEYLTYFDNKYKKIYAYEITKESLHIMKKNLAKEKNIKYSSKAIIDSKKELHILKSKVDNSANQINLKGTDKIKATSLDLDIKEKITMIKMDIEGSEYQALLGSKKHIQNDKPKLLISVYHNHEDLYRIPKLIKKFEPNYKFYLRYYGNEVFPTEIVLIATCEQN